MAINRERDNWHDPRVMSANLLALKLKGPSDSVLNQMSGIQQDGITLSLRSVVMLLAAPDVLMTQFNSTL